MGSKAGFVLGLIGGILDILGGLFFLALTIFGLVLTSTVIPALPGGVDFSGGNLVYMPIILTIWFFIWGILSIVWAVKMNKDDEDSVRFGGIMSIISGVLCSNIFVLIGGIVGVVQSGNEGSSPAPARQSQRSSGNDSGQAVNDYLKQING